MASSARPDSTSLVLRQERLIVIAAIGLLVAASWWFLLTGAGLDDGMGGMAMTPPPLSALVLMWSLMMVAMMLPSAAPAILLYGRVRAIRGGDDVARTWVFLAGYLAIWLLFAILAAFAQSLLAGPSMALSGETAPAVLLIAAGVYQLSPLKSACLRECRSPAQFISRHWRRGVTGALRLGMLHGGYCVGCCWLLMALLFVGGVMNFAWIAALTLIIGIEKLVPRGEWLGRAAGVGLIAWGIARLVS